MGSRRVSSRGTLTHARYAGRRPAEQHAALAISGDLAARADEECLLSRWERFLWYDDIVRGASAILFDRHHQLAVVSTRQGLFLPGGGLEPGEASEQALRREIRSVFRFGHEDPSQLPNAAIIAVAAAALLAAWGVFIRLNRSAEELEPEAMQRAKREDEKVE